MNRVHANRRLHTLAASIVIVVGLAVAALLGTGCSDSDKMIFDASSRLISSPLADPRPSPFFDADLFEKLVLKQ